MVSGRIGDERMGVAVGRWRGKSGTGGSPNLIANVTAHSKDAKTTSI